MNRHIYALGILLVTLVFVQGSFAQANRENLRNNEITGKASEPIIEAKLLTAGDGWARTKNTLVRTSDAGHTWRDITPGSGAGVIYDVDFRSPSEGWLIRKLAAIDDSVASGLEIAQTADGGTTWTKQTVSGLGDDFSVLFGEQASLEFVDERNGWIMLRHTASKNFSIGRLFVTADGGANWKELPAPPIYSKLKFINERDGWLAGGASGSELYVTHDGGQTWKTSTIKVNSDQGFDVTYDLPIFNDESTGILPVTYITQNKPVVEFFETDNRGLSWKHKTTMRIDATADTFTRAVISAVPFGPIMAVLPQARHIQLGTDDRKYDLRAVLTEDAALLSISFNTEDVGWVLTSAGTCRGFKTDCSQSTRLMLLQGNGNVKDISPKIPRADVESPDGNSPDFVVYSNQKGFDKCAVPTVSQMQTWWNSSPYFDANVYIGGSSRSCAQANLSSSWVSQVLAQQWKLILTWVGPQAPCSSFASRFSSDAATARSQGIAEANSATAVASQLGLNPQTIIYYDLEHYNTTASCSVGVKAFLDGWTARLHQLGNMSGVYGSPINASGDWTSVANAPDAVWLAKWDDRVTVWGLTPLSDSFWNNHQRIHQYHGGHDETYGGVTFNIDNDYSDGPEAGSGSGSCYYSISPTSQSFTSPGGTGTINITTTSGCSWTATSNASWININSGASGIGNGTVGYSVSGNTGAARSGTLTVAGQTFTVSQSAAPACPSPASINVGQTINGSLQSGDCLYTDGSYYDAYTFNGTAGQQVYITLNSTQFNAYLLLYQGNYPGGTFLAGDDNGGGGTNARIPTMSGLFALPATGQYTILANSFAAGETGSYSLFLGTGTVCTYSITSSGQSVGSGSGNGSYGLNTQAGCTWSAVSSNTSWLTTSSTGMGSGTVQYNYTANTGTAQRVATITIQGQVHTVTQAGIGCSYSITSSGQSVGSGSGNGSYGLNTQAGCTWSAVSSNTSWLTTSSTGMGSGTVQYNYTANTGTAQRVATITIQGQVHIVTQSGAVSTVRRPFDFDGDGRTDLSIFRPGPGQWWYNKSSNGGNGAVQFGSSTDKIGAADYTGDGKTDIAFWRPSTGEWFVLRSEDSSFFAFPFGTNGDVPVPADYDGDGKSDAAVFRPSTVTWYIGKSTGGTQITTFGAAGDLAVPADYDGDDKADLAIFRPSVGQWWIQRSSNMTVFAMTFGTSTDKAVAGDYTGDGKTDVAFWRPSTGAWFISRSEDSSYYSFPFGTTGDMPAPGDYDGDGRMDAAVFRPSNSTWYANRTSAGILIQGFGQVGDVPVPNAFVR